MAQPQVPIEVDDASGRWFVDNLPMILVPQHFFLNNHFALEQALGPAEYARVLAPAGHRSAYFWCEREADTTSCRAFYPQKLRHVPAVSI